MATLLLRHAAADTSVAPSTTPETAPETRLRPDAPGSRPPGLAPQRIAQVADAVGQQQVADEGAGHGPGCGRGIAGPGRVRRIGRDLADLGGAELAHQAACRPGRRGRYQDVQAEQVRPAGQREHQLEVPADEPAVDVEAGDGLPGRALLLQHGHPGRGARPGVVAGTGVDRGLDHLGPVGGQPGAHRGVPRPALSRVQAEILGALAGQRAGQRRVGGEPGRQVAGV